MRRPKGGTAAQGLQLVHAAVVAVEGLRSEVKIWYYFNSIDTVMNHSECIKVTVVMNTKIITTTFRSLVDTE